MFLQRITRVHILLAVFFACLVSVAHATDIQEEIQYKESVIQKLKEEITQIDSEMMRCQDTKKKWKTL